MTLPPDDCSRCFNLRRAKREKLVAQGAEGATLEDMVRSTVCDEHQREADHRRKLDRSNERARERRARRS